MDNLADKPGVVAGFDFLDDRAFKFDGTLADRWGFNLDRSFGGKPGGLILVFIPARMFTAIADRRQDFPGRDVDHELLGSLQDTKRMAGWGNTDSKERRVKGEDMNQADRDDVMFDGYEHARETGEEPERLGKVVHA